MRDLKTRVSREVRVLRLWLRRHNGVTSGWPGVWAPTGAAERRIHGILRNPRFQETVNRCDHIGIAAVEGAHHATRACLDVIERRIRRFRLPVSRNPNGRQAVQSQNGRRRILLRHRASAAARPLSRRKVAGDC